GNLSSKRIAIGFSTHAPDATLEVGDGTKNFIDGNGDILVSNDIEIDGTAYVSTINGTNASFSNTLRTNKLLATGSVNGANLNISNNATITNTATVGKLISNSNINGTNLNISGNVTFSSVGSTGAIPFMGASGALSSDSSKLSWNNTTKRLSVGTTSN
ncbi:MAG: hypothetical protein ACK55Z_27560, partial [bacterium]